MWPHTAVTGTGDRSSGGGGAEPSSLVELATLFALRANSLPHFRPPAASERTPIVPAPMRSAAQRARERTVLEADKAVFRAQGVVTPAWGAAFGYDSNRSSGAASEPPGQVGAGASLAKL